MLSAYGNDKADWVELIRRCGEYLISNAEKIGVDLPYQSALDIDISIGVKSIPEITVSSRACPTIREQ